MKQPFIIALLSILVFSFSGKAQDVKISVSNTSKETLPGATIECTKVEDGSVSYETTNNNGVAIFKSLENTLYKMKISFVGYQTIEKSIMVKPNARTFYFRLKEESIELDAVEVKAVKPLIRQEEDKIIIDPKNLVDISSNTLEVLESTPGLYVDQDNGIYLNSATPAKIYINGREQKMSTQDITTILQSLPPGSIEKIEVMRTPSAKYDAASSGGIINIVLKKGIKIGRFGSVNASLNQGEYTSGHVGFSINNSGDRSTSYLHANYNHSDREEILNTNRYIEGDTILRQAAITHRHGDYFYLGYGYNYVPNDTLDLSYDGRMNYGMPVAETDNSNYTETPDLERLAANDNIINKDSRSFNLQQDFSVKYKLDTIGSNLDSRLGYNFYNNNSDQDYNYHFTEPMDFNIAGFGENIQQRHFLVGQSDLTYKFPYKISMETGLKSSFQNYESKSDYYLDFSGTVINDTLRTNSFLYKENINAAYLQASKTFGKDLILKAGLRAEHTYMDGNQSIPTDTSFLINRVDLFPYVYLSRNIIHIMGIDLRAYMIYRKTINRPGYQMLNPYINYVDQYMYEAGNPALKPQFSDNVEFNISFNDYPVFAMGQTYTTDIFTEVIYTDENVEDVVIRTYDNLGKSKESYIRATVGIPPGGVYFFAMGGQYNYHEYDGYYQGEPLEYARGSWRFFTFHVLKITKKTKLIMNGFMMVDGQLGFIELDDFWGFNVGLRQSFMKDKLQLSFNARDIFRTMVVNFTVNQNNVQTYGDRYTDDQRFGIKLRYKFGIPERKERSDNPFDFEDME